MGMQRSIFTDRTGGTSIEYAFLVCMIALALIGSLNLASSAVGSTMTAAGNEMDNAPGMQPKL